MSIFFPEKVASRLPCGCRDPIRLINFSSVAQWHTLAAKCKIKCGTVKRVGKDTWEKRKANHARVVNICSKVLLEGSTAWMVLTALRTNELPHRSTVPTAVRKANAILLGVSSSLNRAHVTGKCTWYTFASPPLKTHSAQSSHG